MNQNLERYHFSIDYHPIPAHSDEATTLLMLVTNLIFVDTSDLHV